MYHGMNYRAFSDHLSRLARTGRSFQEPFDFIIRHSLTQPANDSTATSRAILALKDNAQLHPVSPLPLPEPNSGQLIFIRGYATQPWVKAIGARYPIDGEFFRRHLDFLTTPEDFYDLPPLPSGNCSILRLRLTNIFRRQSHLTMEEVQAYRSKEVGDVMNYQEEIARQTNCGSTLVRRYSIHNESTFTLEHNITILVKGSLNLNRGWSGKLLS